MPPTAKLPRARFPAHHAWDRDFHLAMLALFWLGVVLGFQPAVGARLGGQADYPAPPILLVHMAAFTAWMLLLTAQVLLVRGRRVALHRRLGLSGFALIPVMALSGLFAEIYSQQFYFDHPPNSQQFFIIPIWYSLAFPVLAGFALAFRRDAAAHKRLILLATSVICGAAWARFLGAPIASLLGTGHGSMLMENYTATNLLLALIAGYDLLSRGRVHRMTTRGIAFILAGEVATAVIYHSPAWLPVARALIGR